MKMKRDTSADELAGSPIHLLHRAGQCAGELFAEQVEERDLTPRQYAVLVAVFSNEGVSQTGLVERTGIDRSTLADIVRRMLKKGLLQRRRTKEDARAYAVRLTESGRKMLEHCRPLVELVDGAILGAIPEKRRGQFVSDLSAIVATLDDRRKQPSKG